MRKNMDGNILPQKKVSENFIYSFWSVIIVGIFAEKFLKEKKLA